MNKLQIFNNSQFGEIRTLEENGKPLFCGSDVAKALGYAKPNNAINDHCKGDTLKRGIIDNLGRKQNATFIGEGDLYRLITNSKLPTAQQFESWVFDEVLPSIRKTGSYSMTDNQKMIAQTRQENIRIRKAALLNKIADQYTGTYKQVLQAHATKELTGEFLLPLPQLERKTLSATEIGEMLGVSGNKIGSIANKNNLKTSQNGAYFKDKSRYSNKEVETFRYFESAVDVFKRFI